MPRRIHSDASDKARALSENLRHRGDGLTVLTSKNEADNPTFDRFDVDGKLEGVTLTGPLEESGFKAYGKGPGSPDYISLQAVVPRTEPYYEQRAPFVIGDTPPDAARPSSLSPYALPPRIELIASTNVGFAGGWRSLTWGYGIEVDGRLFVTNVAPLLTMNVPNGVGFRVTWPGGVPENVPMLVFACTTARATENEAANASGIWVQGTVSTRPRVPSVTDFWGPEQHSKNMRFLSTDNETFLGQIGAPRISVRGGGSDQYEGHFSGYFVTHFGKSQSFTVADYKVKNQVISWEPSSWKAGATAWVAQWVDEEGNWRESGTLPRGTKAYQDTNITDKLGGIRADSDLIDEDTSGVEAPDSALDAITIGSSVPTTGEQSWRITKYGTDPETQREDESPPSPVANISVPIGNMVRVHPPYGSGNWIANAEGNLTGQDGIPLGWERPTVTSIAFDDSVPGVQKFTDASSSSSSADITRTPSSDVEAKPNLTSLVRIVVSGRTSGRVDWVAQQTNLDSTTTEFTLASFSANGTYDVRTRISGIVNSQAGPGQPYAQLGYNPNVKSLRFILRHVGSGGTGVRNLASSIYNLGMFQGEAHPHKRYSVDPRTLLPVSNEHNASLSTEPPEQPYPSSGYVYTVINPDNSQRAVISAGNYVSGNMVEFFGPFGTRVLSTYFISGIRTPVRPGEQRTVSAYLYWQGVVSPGNPLRVVVKNSTGAVVQDLGGFVENVTGDSWASGDADENGYVRRQKNFVVHPEGAYVEVISGGVGDGLWRVMGMQNEIGAVATEFSDDYVDFGSMVSTFDLAIPGVPEDELHTLAYVDRIVGFGADVTHVNVGGDQITDHTVFVRFKHRNDDEYGEWYTSVSEIEGFQIGSDYHVQVGTILSTTNINYTPVLRSHYIDFERSTDMHSAAIGQLVRYDGTEFDGTCLVFDFPNIKRERPLIEDVSADNTPGFAEFGNSRYWARGFGIQCFLNSTAEEIMSLVGEGIANDSDTDDDAGTFIAEIYGERYRLRILSIDLLSPDRQGYLPMRGSNEKRWLIEASGIAGELMARETF